MNCQRAIISGVFYALLIKALAGSDVLDDANILPDFSFHPENLASDDMKLSSAQDFYDETDFAGGYDDDFSIFTDSSLDTNSPSDVSTSTSSDDSDSILPSPPSEGSDSDLSLFEDSGCSSNINRTKRKRETGEMCPTDSSNPPWPDPAFERGGSSDPEFYGLSLIGYDTEMLGSEEETNGCRRDAFGLAQFLVCDSGKNEDRFTFYAKTGLMAAGISLKNCQRSRSNIFDFFFFPFSPFLFGEMERRNSITINVSDLRDWGLIAYSIFFR